METRAPHPLTPKDTLFDWLQLTRSENVGPLTFRDLLNHYGTVRAALEALPELAVRGGRTRPLKVASPLEIEKELEATHGFGARIVTMEDPLYPPLLGHIESAPPVITVKGQLSHLQNPLFAIVGARNASLMGKKIAGRLAGDLGNQGWVVASGLARGIDTAAHQGSLQTGTVAVLAGGIDNIYPSENELLYHRIAQEGVLVAESPFGTKPHATLFPRRNRIVSGISRATVVVEAAFKSGSLITARYALEQGREVFAVPGHPFDPRARGCNKLIKNGAVLVESFEDIDQEISPRTPFYPEPHVVECEESSPPRPLEDVRQILKENLSVVPISVDEVMRECQLSASELWIAILEMELAGYLERHPGAKISLKEEWNSA